MRSSMFDSECDKRVAECAALEGLQRLPDPTARCWCRPSARAQPTKVREHVVTAYREIVASNLPMRNSSSRAELGIRNVANFARDVFEADRLRFSLTALGMVIGTTSLILVTTVSLAGKHYVMDEIQSIGSNWIYVEHQSVAAAPNTLSDNLTIDDMEAVQQQVPGIVAASPVLLPVIERVSVGGGKTRAVQIMGVSPEYRRVRNLVQVSGRFFDRDDSLAYNKVGVINARLANELYGSPQAAVGHTLKCNSLPFLVVGVFRERVDTFGQSEVTDVTVLVPYTVVQYLEPAPMVKQIFFSTANAASVVPLTVAVRRVIRERHRPESVYHVRNLTALLKVAGKTANAMSLLLLGVSFIVLIVSGISIMNIMLDNVNQRVSEIGIRRAVGATRRDIRLQFLSEAVLISLVGGTLGVVLGFAIPASLGFITRHHLPTSSFAAGLAVVVCAGVGVVFGTIPAARAARLDPAESLRH